MDESCHLDEKTLVGWNIQIMDENTFGWVKFILKKTLPSSDWC
jgi:hypothetical protein